MIPQMKCFTRLLFAALLASVAGFVIRTSGGSPIRHAKPTFPKNGDGVVVGNPDSWAFRHSLTILPLSTSPPDDRQAGIDVEWDERLYRISLSRATGIEWGTDLSFSFVNVRGMDPAGAAAMSGKIQVGDQLCELRAVEEGSSPVNLVGAPFDFVMEAFADLDKTVTDVELVFFRGTKDELKAAAKGEPVSSEPEMITVTVVENKGSKKETIQTLTAPAGVNVRQLCVDSGINVYQSVTRWTNCKGKQLCGTCIVNVKGGAINTNRKSMDEESTLRENPGSYRLSCVTFAYGDVTIETFPPIEAAQWTR